MKYTHPSKVSTVEAVANAVKDELATSGIDREVGEKREAAVKFAVSIAHKHLKFLRSNMTWDWRGHALAAILRKCGKNMETEPSAFNNLSVAERILFLKYFLEADGALVSALADEIALRGDTSRDYLIERFEGILRNIFDSYEELATDFRERIHMRDRRRETVRQTKGEKRQHSTLVHKVLPHIQALVDLGVLVQSEDGRVFRSATYGGSASVAPIRSYAHRLEELDQLFSDENENPYALISAVYGLQPNSISAEADWGQIKTAILDAYQMLKDPGTGMAYIQSVTDWCCVVLLSDCGKLASPQEMRNGIDLLYEKDPGMVRFHVDFRGDKTYMILSDPSFH